MINRVAAHIVCSVFVLFGLQAGAASAAAQQANKPNATVGKQVTKGEYDSYIVVMELDPAIAYEGGVNKYQATKPGKGNKINPKSAHVRKYTQFLTQSHDQTLAAAGLRSGAKLHDYTIALNGFAAQMTHEQAVRIASMKGVQRVVPDVLRQRTTDNSAKFLNLDSPAGPWLKGYDGEGVIVGVIDDGIWPEHPSFADDGSFAAPPVDPLPCEFGNTAHNPNDAPFTCNNKLIGARQMLATYRAIIGADPDEFDSARDDNGHGTHTASTAAGNAGVESSILGVPRGTVSGVAPRAYVIAYKGLGNLGGFGSDLAAAIDQAVADGVDVINYSVGGGASLTGADDIAYLFAADAGVFVAAAAGNSGPGAGTIGGPASVPWLTSVGASTQDRTFQGSALSSDGWEFFGASITAGTTELPLVDAEDAGDDLCNPGALDPAAVVGKIVLCRRGAIDRVAKSEAVYQAGGAGMILYNANDGQSQATDTHWVPSVHINNTDGLVIKDYIANTGNPVATINGGVFTPIDAPWMASFSSRGSNTVAEDIIKPDITAPGVNILAGWSPFPDPGNVGGQLYSSISGTSMSSPHVAGVFALIKQAHPDWTPAMAKSALMTTSYQAVKKEDGVAAADPFDMGAGHINPGGKANKGSVFEPGLVYDAGFLDYLGFLCDAEPSALSPSTCPTLESIGVPTDASDLNLASIGVAELPGSQTVTRTVTSVANERGWRDFNVEVDAPPGYHVTVSPSSLRLKRGMSASYDVTITNESAAIGQWAFGSLTWADSTGHYTVRSPIAVRGSLFNAATSIAGSGETGNASFDIQFGYTGPYTAFPIGLQAATVTSDNVVQDPDQDFDPTDGYSNRHDIVVPAAGTLLRIVMPPDAVSDPAVDLDLYLYDPAGNQVAASTSGGTDEFLEIAFPETGIWSVYVHGWQTAGPSADYDMYHWVFDNTGGPSLSVDSAPDSAEIGETGVVDISWTGATSGEWHLGIIGHIGATGVMGGTIVEVDNR